MLHWALTEVSWRSEEIVLYGRRHLVPRQVAWYGDPRVSYRYSGSEHPACGWPPILRDLRTKLTAELDERPNFVLFNRYRSGRDTMGWHRDDESMRNDLIGSISLGATRRFLVRRVAGEPSRRLDLEHGSLLLLNRHLSHALPRTRRQVAERVNLTFRVLA